MKYIDVYTYSYTVYTSYIHTYIFIYTILYIQIQEPSRSRI